MKIHLRWLKTLSLLTIVLVASASAAHAQTDWTTFGFDQQRTGYNPHETILSQANVSRLGVKWSTDVWGTMLAQPTVVNNVMTAAGLKTLVFVATLYGDVDALDAATGKLVWQVSMPAVQTNCGDFGAAMGFAGVIGTPTIDKANNRMFLVAGDGYLHAISLSNGQELPGFGVQILTGADRPPHTVAYGSPTFDAAHGWVYVATASVCDFPPYHGQVIQVDVNPKAPKLLNRFYVMQSVNGVTPSGGGIWGPGGVSIPADLVAVYAATGNAIGAQNAPYAESILRLSPNLALTAYNTQTFTNGGDQDYGATPLLYSPPGCPAQLAAMNKSGALVIYDRGVAVGYGPRQRLQVSGGYNADAGDFIGIPAYDPTRNRMFLGNPSDSAIYQHGLVALKMGANCQWGLAWQAQTGVNNSPDNNPMIPPTVANGVVYYSNGLGSQLFAYNADTGQQLWNSGTTISGDVLAAPTVVNGTVYAASYLGHTVFAFGLQ